MRFNRLKKKFTECILGPNKTFSLLSGVPEGWWLVPAPRAESDKITPTDIEGEQQRLHVRRDIVE